MTISEQYNELPIQIRNITSQILLIYQIRDLEIEKRRAIKHHKAHLREINGHIENCKKDLIQS